MTLWADRDMVRRALLNLVLNAIDVMPSGGELTIIGCETKYGIEIEVADSGPGLPEDSATLFSARRKSTVEKFVP